MSVKPIPQGYTSLTPFLWRRGQNNAFKPDGTQGFADPVGG
jgi:hypothetical protein